MKRILAVALLATASCWAQKDDSWKPFQALIGDWVGEGGGGPGQGGGFSYEFDLQRNVIVRKNYAEYTVLGWQVPNICCRREGFVAGRRSV